MVARLPDAAVPPHKRHVESIVVDPKVVDFAASGPTVESAYRQASCWRTGVTSDAADVNHVLHSDAVDHGSDRSKFAVNNEQLVHPLPDVGAWLVTFIEFDFIIYSVNPIVHCKRHADAAVVAVTKIPPWRGSARILVSICPVLHSKRRLRTSNVRQLRPRCDCETTEWNLPYHYIPAVLRGGVPAIAESLSEDRPAPVHFYQPIRQLVWQG